MISNGGATYFTIFVTSSDSFRVKRIRVSALLAKALATCVVIGGIGVGVSARSYIRALFRAQDYNALRTEQVNLIRRYRLLSAQMTNTSQRLDSVQALADEMTIAEGARPLTNTGISSVQAFRRSLEEFEYLRVVPLESPGPNAGLRLASESSIHLPFVPDLWPVNGRITARFGERLDPFSGEGAFHTGIDIASHYGDEVRSAADGIVVFAAEQGGYGNSVVVDHGFGYSTLYAHLSKISTAVGTSVKRGDTVGYEGQSGRATGPHVHYEVRINNKPVDPWRYLRAPANSNGVETNAAD